jgi:hypothetical protein
MSLVAGSCALGLTLAAGCAGNDGPAASRSEPNQSTASGGAAEEVSGVPLAEPVPGFAQHCQDAARSLGFAVPCPTRLPLIGGERVGCSASCVGTVGGDGEEARIFVLNVEGYDDRADAPEAVRHLAVEAFKAAERPPSPCYEGVPAGTLDVSGLEVVLLECPPSSAEAQATNRHGEGIHAGHLLGYWDRRGVRYVVSVHRTTDDSSALLERLVSSIELVDP